LGALIPSTLNRNAHGEDPDPRATRVRRARTRAARASVSRVRVRPITDADLDACVALFEAVAAEGRWLATEAPIDRREVRTRWVALVGTGEGALLVAEEDDGRGPLGLAAMVGRTSPELGMLVALGHRRRGIGDALLDACVAWA